MVSTDPLSPSWPVRLLADVEESDDRASKVANGLSVAQLNWKPEPHSWSVGQCLQHLLAGNDVYLPAMARALDGHSPSPVQEITPGWFSRWMIRTYFEPSPGTKRLRAPRKIAPASEVDGSILDRFLRSNDAARNLIRRAAACDVNRIRFTNPFIPMLRFTVGTGLEITCAHQRRHLLQAERVRQDGSFPMTLAGPPQNPTDRRL